MTGNLTFNYNCKTIAMNICNTSYKRQHLFELENSVVVNVYGRHDWTNWNDLQDRNDCFPEFRADFLPNEVEEFSKYFTRPHLKPPWRVGFLH